jgi:2,3,4,5-tetrahydropyridine-2,6-dicarboxylate N-succinyltransferase
MSAQSFTTSYDSTPTADNPDSLPESTSSNFWANLLHDRFDLIESADVESIERQTVLIEILHALEQGHLRVAEPLLAGGWTVRGWVKRALIALGSSGVVTTQTGPLPGTELTTLGWREARSLDTRVPAGSHIRSGCYLAPGVSIMPPSTIQAGAWLGSGVRVDSHVLVGSCAQIGEGVVLGCGTMVGGIILPESALPIILEAGVLVGGNCGLYGSLWIGEHAMLQPGTIVQAAEGVFDSTTGEWLQPGPDAVLRIPPRAQLAMGLPPSEHLRSGIQRIAPVIFDYDADLNPV